DSTLAGMSVPPDEWTVAASAYGRGRLGTGVDGGVVRRAPRRPVCRAITNRGADRLRAPARGRTGFRHFAGVAVVDGGDVDGHEPDGGPRSPLGPRRRHYPLRDRGIS